MTTNAAPTQKLQNDVETIRSILFGEQSQDFQQRISALEKWVAALQDENERLKEVLESETKTREEHEARGSKSLEAAKADILGQLNQVGDQFGSQSTTDRKNFQQALEDQKKQIDSQIQELRGEFVATIHAHQLKQDALIDALAKALLAYQNET